MKGLDCNAASAFRWDIRSNKVANVSWSSSFSHTSATVRKASSQSSRQPGGVWDQRLLLPFGRRTRSLLPRSLVCKACLNSCLSICFIVVASETATKHASIEPACSRRTPALALLIFVQVGQNVGDSLVLRRGLLPFSLPETKRIRRTRMTMSIYWDV